MPTAALLVTALTLSLLADSVQAFPRRCACIGFHSSPIPSQCVKKVEMYPITGHCRRAEVIITRQDDVKTCVNPQSPWVRKLLIQLRRKRRSAPTHTAVVC